MSRPDNLQWEFGSFRFDADQHLLFRDGQLVPLSPKATDILLVLIENHGQLVEKDALMKAVWPDSFVEESNLAVHISQLRKALSEENSSHRIETIPRRGYRFLGEVRRVSLDSPEPAPADAAASSGVLARSESKQRKTGWLPAIAVALALAVAWIAISVYRHSSRAGASHGSPNTAAASLKTSSIILADIANNTGDPVFNNTLRQGMAIELEQSPHLRLVSESRIRQSLLLMGKPADSQLTPEIAHDLCQRTGSEAVLEGWISRLGSQYVLGVRAVNCRTGDQMAEMQTTAAGKEQVLKALGDITGQLRARLGESLSTVQRFDTPIEQATTPSLEALQAYSLGMAAMIQKGESSAGVPFFHRAIRLDPDFAVAYAALGNAYSNLGETGEAAANLRRAYELRSRVSERERLYIESHYHELVTGDLTKARVIYQTWAATYPDDVAPRIDLALIDSNLGELEASLDEAKAAMSIAPDDGLNYSNLANAYIALDRLGEARGVIDQAIAKKFNASDMHLYLYDIAFLQNDADAMQQQLAWARGEPGFEDLFLGHHAATLAAAGQIAKAREFTRRAIDAAKRSGQKETAAGYAVTGAQYEALLGDPGNAQALAATALALAKDRDTRYGAALALALAGAFERANAIALQLNNDFPDDTLVQSEYMPSILGAVALKQKDPALAIRALEPAAPYEQGEVVALFPAYLRGVAYLNSSDGARAQAEFERILQHPGVVLNSPIGPLAHLGLARALRQQGNSAQAKAAYRDFLNRWKDADSTLPTLLAAKEESAKEDSAK